MALVGDPADFDAIDHYVQLLLGWNRSITGLRYLRWLITDATRHSRAIQMLLTQLHSRCPWVPASPGALDGPSHKAARKFLLNPRDESAVRKYRFELGRSQEPVNVFRRTGINSPFDGRGQWQRIAVAPPSRSGAAGMRTVRPMIVHDGHLHVAFSDDDKGSSKIQRWNGGSWETIAGRDTWRDLGLPDQNRIGALCSWRGSLYVSGGQDRVPGTARVYRFDGEKWRNLSLPEYGWTATDDMQINPLIVNRDQLYGGTFNRKAHGGAAVVRFDGERWRRDPLNARGDVDGFTCAEVYDFAEAHGRLYCCTAGFYRSSGTIWRLGLNGQDWELVGGRGVRRSWPTGWSSYIEALAVYQGRLVVSMDRPRTVEDLLPSIWSFDGDSWEPIWARDDSGVMSRSKNYNHLFVYEGRLLAATGSSSPIDLPAEVAIWELGDAGDVWRRVAGAGIAGSWTGESLSAANPRNSVWIYRMIAHHGDLYAGLSFGLHGGTAEVWRYGRG